jgi:hypothetical protein
MPPPRYKTLDVVRRERGPLDLRQSNHGMKIEPELESSRRPQRLTVYAERLAVSIEVVKKTAQRIGCVHTVEQYDVQSHCQYEACLADIECPSPAGQSSHEPVSRLQSHRAFRELAHVCDRWQLIGCGTHPLVVGRPVDRDPK